MRHNAGKSTNEVSPTQEMKEVRAMNDDNNEATQVIPASVFWDDYYESLHIAYNALRQAFNDSGLTQDELAIRTGIDKSLVSKYLNGSENLTIKTLSQMGAGMNYRLVVAYQPYDQLGISHETTLTTSSSTQNEA